MQHPTQTIAHRDELERLAINRSRAGTTRKAVLGKEKVKFSIESFQYWEYPTFSQPCQVWERSTCNLVIRGLIMRQKKFAFCLGKVMQSSTCVLRSGIQYALRATLAVP